MQCSNKYEAVVYLRGYRVANAALLFYTEIVELGNSHKNKREYLYNLHMDSTQN